MRLTIKVEDDVIAGLGRMATIDGRAIEVLVDEALRQYLAEHPRRPMPVRKSMAPPPDDD
ncbi:MAG: hypothetical protein WD058_04335 [Dehalococcoidia bacterium]